MLGAVLPEAGRGAIIVEFILLIVEGNGGWRAVSFRLSRAIRPLPHSSPAGPPAPPARSGPPYSAAERSTERIGISGRSGMLFASSPGQLCGIPPSVNPRRIVVPVSYSQYIAGRPLSASQRWWTNQLSYRRRPPVDPGEILLRAAGLAGDLHRTARKRPDGLNVPETAVVPVEEIPLPRVVQRKSEGEQPVFPLKAQEGVLRTPGGFRRIVGEKEVILIVFEPDPLVLIARLQQRRLGILGKGVQIVQQRPLYFGNSCGELFERRQGRTVPGLSCFNILLLRPFFLRLVFIPDCGRCCARSGGCAASARSCGVSGWRISLTSSATVAAASWSSSWSMVVNSGVIQPEMPESSEVTSERSSGILMPRRWSSCRTGRATPSPQAISAVGSCLSNWSSRWLDPSVRGRCT